MAERDTVAVNLAKDRAGARNFRNNGRFAKAHLADALAECSITADEFAHTAKRASRELTERQAGARRDHGHCSVRRTKLRLGFNEWAKKRLERGNANEPKSFIVCGVSDRVGFRCSARGFGGARILSGPYPWRP